MLTTPLQLGSGEAFRYSDIGFILLGALIEKVTGEPEDVYVQRNVFAPLGMQDTPYLPPAKRVVDPLLAPDYPAIKGQNLRGFGWDIDTGQSQPRGMVFPIGSFGHTGFTGTSLWMDAGSNTYVVLLSNSIHVRGSSPISDLLGGVVTLAAKALRLYGSG